MERVKWTSSGWLPVLLGSTLFAGVIVSYIWAVIRKDVPAFLPFISDAGGYPPQSGVFAIFLFMSASFGFLAMVIRYYSLRTLAEGMKGAKRLNNVSVFLGVLTLIGMIIVASYPVNTKPKDKDEAGKGVVLPHTLGAMIAFMIGLIYAISQTILSYMVRPSRRHSSQPMILFYTRCVIVLTAFASLIIMLAVPFQKPEVIPDSSNSTTTVSPDTDTWKSEGKQANAVAEWVLAFALFSFFVSLYPEMKHFGVEITIARKSEFRTLNERSSQNTSQSTISS